ncbi:LCP family protein [Nonomuraea sp. NPDC046570]|uniref:LCP family protein n=1 Tax=Nonomuraea sp. NPDC046570 TaxID=3155255 RepID=UPI0033CF535D
MRDPDEQDAGVHVGGDAYGGVKLQGRRTRRPGRGARTRRRNLVVAGTLSSLVLAGSGVVWAGTTFATGKIAAVDAGVAGSASRGAMNILLVGVDKRDDLSRKEQNKLKLGREVGERTDTMMVVHLSEDHRKVTVVSLPRDTWTTIPGQGMHKINSAYQFGKAKLAVKTVEQATGLRINHYIEVNVLGFIDVIDSLGGITVCTPVPINDSKIALTLAAGTHELKGPEALGYARTRATARSDLDRIDRQQQVISALLDKALSSGTLASPARLSGLIDSSLRTITVDKELKSDLLGLAGQLKDVSLNDVRFATVPLADVDFKTPTGESAVLWDKKGAEDLFRRISADEDLAKPSAKPTPTVKATPTTTATAVPPERVTLTVLNGTLITGLGARTKNALVEAGFKVPDEPGNTARKDHTKTIVRYGPGLKDSARTVAAAIPGADLREVDIKGIEVVIGSDQPKIRKAKDATKPTPSPSPSATPTTRTATQNICKK